MSYLRAMTRWCRIVGVLGCATPLLAHAACKLETLELPVTMVGTRATATVGINGTQVPMTVDSGAFFSMLTDAAAEQLKLPTRKNPSLRVEGISGRAETRVTKVDKVQLFKGDIPGVEFIVGGNEPGGGTMGLMGRNMLSVSDTEYDLAHGAIRFLFPNGDCAKLNMAYWEEGSSPVTEIELVPDYRTKTPPIRAKVKLNGQEFVALFDTGATTVISLRAARRAGIADTDLKPAGFVYGVGRGRSDAWTTLFDKFELGGEAISNNRMRVADLDLGDADMLLGVDFFLSHRIYVSKQQSRLFITYNGGPVFALDRRQVASAGVAPGDARADDAQATTADQFARRGAASAARREFDSALADLDKACELEPTSAAFFAQRGAIQQALRHPVKARADLDKALELDPNQVDARFGRVVLRSSAKDRDGTKADLDALDRILPPQAQMRLPMSTFYMAMEQPALALVQLDQWLPAHPNEIGRDAALNTRCWARMLTGVDLDKALNDCDDAVDSDAKNATYLDSRGWVYLRLGKYKKALSDFDHSVEVRPKNAWALYGRGLAKTKLGDGVQGDDDFAAARKVVPDIEVRLVRSGLIPEGVGKQ